MKNVDIIVMGKTGAGKSTLINAVLGEDMALTGKGQAVTKKNAVYSKIMMLPTYHAVENGYGFANCRLNMHDTVGLEIDEKITDATLEEIRTHIQRIKKKTTESGIYLVWFCVNDRCSRIESYEIDLIRKLSLEYEIPFVIVLTQCFVDEEGDLEIKISRSMPQVTIKRIMAKDYAMRKGTIRAFGVPDLVNTSIENYENLKIDIIEKKLNELDENRITRINEIKNRGNSCIAKYRDTATKVGVAPAGCIPIVHGICVKMIADLNLIAGLGKGKDFAEEIFTYVVAGIVYTPLMAVPLLSMAVANAYIETIGESYLQSLLNVIDQSTDKELFDNQLMKERLKEELTKLKK